jgi:hypothetical protein
MKKLYSLLFAFSALASSSCSSPGNASPEAPEETLSKQPDQTLEEKPTRDYSALQTQLKKDIAEHEANTFTPDQLVNAYVTNRTLADKTYKNQKIYVEGKVESIEKDALDKTYILLKSKNGVHSVQAYLPTSATASLLEKGQQVTLKGTCKGFVLANVVLTDATEASSLSGLKENLKLSQ